MSPRLYFKHIKKIKHITYFVIITSSHAMYEMHLDSITEVIKKIIENLIS